MGNKKSQPKPNSNVATATKSYSKSNTKDKSPKQQPEAKAFEWIELKRPPRVFSIFQPNPLYFHAKNPKQRYIIFTPGGKSSCILYNISKDEYKTVSNDTTNDSEFRMHGHCIDPQKGCLYVFAASCCSRFNIIDKTWQQNITKYSPYKVEYPSILHIINPFVPKIHILMKGIYFTWKDTENYMIEQGKVSDSQKTDISIPFYANGKLYAIFSENSQERRYVGYGNYAAIADDTIYFCDVLNGANKWECCKFRLPRKNLNLRNGAKLVVAFDCILILFDFESETIYYLDLKKYELDVDVNDDDTESMWVASDIKCEKDKSQFVVIVNNRFIHCIKAYDGGVWDMWHRKISIDAIIGNDLCAKYDGRLVNGWVREYIEYEIPDVIISLIQTYFS